MWESLLPDGQRRQHGSAAVERLTIRERHGQLAHTTNWLRNLDMPDSLIPLESPIREIWREKARPGGLEPPTLGLEGTLSERLYQDGYVLACLKPSKERNNRPESRRFLDPLGAK